MDTDRITPQYDHDPVVLAERCYAHALSSLLLEHDDESWRALTDAERDGSRELLRTELLEGFPQLEADEISAELDAAISDFEAGL